MPVTIHDIQRIVAERVGVTVLDLISDRRGRAFARPRQIAMWLCRHMTTSGITAIGRAFGDRDHSTVLHALWVVDHEIATGTGWGIAASALREDLQMREREAA